jgi:integrase
VAPKNTDRSGDSIYAYETKEGTRYRFVYRDPAGKQSQKRGFTSRTAARRERQRIISQVQRGELRVSRETLGEYWERWLVRRKPHLAPGTYTNYVKDGRNRLLPHFGETKLTALRAPEIEDWLVELSDEDRWAAKTINNALKALRACLSYAVRDGLIPANPASFVPALPDDHIERDYLRLHEINLYLDACSDEYRPLAETLIRTGMRISEAIALNIDDVQLDQGGILVRRAMKGRGQIGTTKSRRPRRVDMGPLLAATLRGVIEQRAGAGPSEPLFVTPPRNGRNGHGGWEGGRVGERLERSIVSSSWHKAALQDAGLRDMPLHSLRHTAAAAWLASGHHLIYVQRQLGHSQITTTERVYAHLEETFMQSAAAQTEEAVARAGGLVIEG